MRTTYPTCRLSSTTSMAATPSTARTGTTTLAWSRARAASTSPGVTARTCLGLRSRRWLKATWRSGPSTFQPRQCSSCRDSGNLAEEHCRRFTGDEHGEMVEVGLGLVDDGQLTTRVEGYLGQCGRGVDHQRRANDQTQAR